MQVSAAVLYAALLWGTKTAFINRICRCSWVLLLIETMMWSNQDATASAQKCTNSTLAKSVRSFCLPVAEMGRNDHILFVFSAICINNILNFENTDIFRKIQESAALYFFFNSTVTWHINVKTVKMTVMALLLLQNITVLIFDDTPIIIHTILDLNTY